MEKLTIVELKEKLREFGLKTSGNKTQLITRLREANVPEPEVNEKAYDMDNQELGQQNLQNIEEVPMTMENMVDKLSENVLRLQRTMESLTQQFQTYSTTTSTIGTNDVLPQNSAAHRFGNYVTSASVTESVEQQQADAEISIFRQLEKQRPQAFVMNDTINKAANIRTYEGNVPNATRSNNVYIPQLFTGNNTNASVEQRNVYVPSYINWPIQTSSIQNVSPLLPHNDVLTSSTVSSVPTMFGCASMYLSPTMSPANVLRMPSISTSNNVVSPGANTDPSPYSSINRWGVREVIDALPTFDPNNNVITSVQFIERVEELKNAYQWSDGLVLFAIRSRFLGAAKLWIDAQPVFKNWQDFVIAFVDDFPCIVNSADIHIQMMKTHQKKNEQLTEYYYTMLAIGRRGQLDDNAIVRYIINGLEDDNLRKSLSVLSFKKCSDLLRALQSVTIGSRRQMPNMPFKHHEPVMKSIERKESGNIGAKPLPKSGPTCYNCREIGHLSRNCPKPLRKPREAVNAIVNQSVITKHVLLGDVKCNALIDSGSGVSLVKQSIVKKLNQNLIKCHKVLQGFAGGEYKCVGSINDIKVTVDGQCFNATLYVVDDDIMTYEVIFGCDILSNGRVIIENGQCQIYAMKNNDIICGENLNINEKEELAGLLNEYADCFAERLDKIGKCGNTKMTITLTSSKPIAKKAYVIPIPKQKVVDRIVGELLELNIIRPSMSEYASPIVLVPKSNGEDRLCVDYRALNSITEKKPWPMPTVDGVLSTLSGKKYFTTLDLMSGYYQIEMEEESKKFTTFITHNGHFEFNRMPFGLKNAPSVFQQMMMKVIEPLKGKVVSYVDEVIVASSSFDDSLRNLEELLKIIRKEGLTLRLSKCYFLKDCVTFLGHEIDCNGIRPGRIKTIAIKEFPRPTTVTEVRRFLGLTGYFRKFVKNYAHIASPITRLTRKDVQFNWSPQCQAAFEKLINAISSEPILGIYDTEKEQELHTDASCVGLAAVLIQREDDGTKKPIAYYSRVCSEVETKYHAYELEILALVEACERFRLYLLGKHFTVYTDCAAISRMKTITPMIPRISRWLLKLLEYDFTACHRPGAQMVHVDAMSRSPVEQPSESEDVTSKLMMVNISNEDWILSMQKQDPELKQIISILKGEIDSSKQKSFMNEFVIKRHRLYKKNKEGGDLLVIPRGVRWRIVKLCHDDIGHPGVDGTVKRINQYFWFRRIRNFVKGYIKCCVECCYSREPTRKEAQLYGMEIPIVPFEVIHMDHLGPFIKSRRGNEYILVVVDAMTRYSVIVPVKSTKTKPVIDALNYLTLYFGLPKRIVTDRGTAFTSTMFGEYCLENNIQHIKVAVRTPRANGLAERINQSVLSYLRTSSNHKEWDNELRNLQWKINTSINTTTKYSPIELIYDFPLKDISANNLLSAVQNDDTSETKQTPAERRENAIKNIELAREKWKKRFDSKHKIPHKYQEGDLILVESAMPSTGESRKLDVKYRGPYVISKVLRFDRYLIEDIEGAQRKQRKFSTVVSSDKIKPWCALFPEVDDDYQIDSDDEDDNEAI